VSVVVNDNDLDIFELIKHSKQLTKTIASLQAQIAEHENSIQSLNSQIENRDQQIQILNREIVDYTSSTSWKITRPLRRLSRLVRRK
jgi:peptidoglycan hydrolase CwlO-like protein